MAPTSVELLLLGAISLCVALPVHGQALQKNTVQIPQGAPFNNSTTENVDFADVDLDGDWDAVFADGGDSGNDQNRIWINLGGLQGGVPGWFDDQTAQRLPAVLDASRDVEFADIDVDGDVDLYISNTASIASQSSRWWINMGGIQGGSPGFFQDETALRWMAIGVNNGVTFSSISPSLKLPSGGFIDWACDCDFGDLDNDGDLDLVHSSYGGAFSGDVPTRIFENVGGGFFEEFNPSHFQLTGSAIQNGAPGLWCEGIQKANTLNTTGAECDVALTALDIEVADIDGDLDLDLLLGARQEPPRMFKNRSQVNGGALGFRDVTNASFSSGYTGGLSHYAQEFGDLDDDADLDLVGMSWLQTGSGFPDALYSNDGTGTFSGPSVIASSTNNDEIEGDFLDYDGDGDLDLYVASENAFDRLYEATAASGSNHFVHVTSTQLLGGGGHSFDADGCDVDADGDSDVFVAEVHGLADLFMENRTQVGDVHAPRLASLEPTADRVAGPDPTVVRVQVYDNAGYYTTWYASTWLDFRVAGGPYVSVPMRSSAGQVFRGEIPGGVAGLVEYRARSIDEHGNVGVSASNTFTSSALSYCTAKPNALGCVPSIGASGQPSVSTGPVFIVSGTNVRNHKSGLLVHGIHGRAAIVFQGGTLCVAPPIRRTPAVSSGGSPPPAQDCTGVFALDMNAFAAGAMGGHPLPELSVAGTVVDCQWWGRDPGFPAPNNSTLTDGLEYVIGS